jgi:hypothetical protein
MLACGLSLSVFAPPAAATLPQPVTFSSQIVVGPFTGTWSATGVVTDSGTLAEPYVNFVGNGELHIERVLTGSNGTITIRIQSKVTSAGGGIITFAGHWVIVAGTGSYASLHGQGDRTATLTAGIVTETLTGEAQFD